MVDFFEDNEAIYMIEKRPKYNLKEYVLKASRHQSIPEAKAGLMVRSMVLALN